MNKKGFTLIELLAVIVILAIIALIATPIILNIIENSKESATIRGAEYYLNAVELAVARARLDNIKVPTGTYEIMDDGDICLVGTRSNCSKRLEVEVTGKIPNFGTITITAGKIDQVELTYDNNKVIKEDGILKFSEKNDTDNNNADAKSLQQAKNYIAAVEVAIAEAKENDSDFDARYCSVVNANKVNCSAYKLIYNEELGYEEEIVLSKELELDINIEEEISGSLGIENGKVSSFGEAGFHIGDNSFVKYPRGEVFLEPIVTEEYISSQVNKYLKAVEDLLAQEIEQNPGFVASSFEVMYDGEIRFFTPEGSPKPSQEIFFVGIDGLLPRPSGFTQVGLVNGKVYLSQFDVYIGRFRVELDENGNLNIQQWGNGEL